MNLGILSIILFPIIGNGQFGSDVNLNSDYDGSSDVVVPVPVGWNLTFVLSGSNLGNETQPFVKVTYRERESLKVEIIEIGQTSFEIDKSSSPNNPIWNNVLWFERHDGIVYDWHFSVYDHLNSDALIGEETINVDRYVESGQNYTLKLKGGTAVAMDLDAKLTIMKTTPIKFKLSATNLPHYDEFGGKSDPYIKVFFRRGIKGANNEIYTTATLNNLEDAEWDEVIEFSNYQRGTDQYLFFEVWDSDSLTWHDHLGDVLINVEEFIKGKKVETFYLENSAGEHSKLIITPVH